ALASSGTPVGSSRQPAGQSWEPPLYRRYQAPRCSGVSVGALRGCVNAFYARWLGAPLTPAANVGDPCLCLPLLSGSLRFVSQTRSSPHAVSTRVHWPRREALQFRPAQRLLPGTSGSDGWLAERSPIDLTSESNCP